MHPRAGQKALSEDLVDVESLLDSYYELPPDPSEPEQAVSFWTSGHRGSSLDIKFNEDHIAATNQAIVEYRTTKGLCGTLFIGLDIHAQSLPNFEPYPDVLLVHVSSV